jgi:aminopeptidase
MSLTASLPEITTTITLATEPDLPAPVVDDAARHVRDILRDAICHMPTQAALIVFDTRCALARALTAAYRRCLPQAQFIDFDAVTPDHIQGQFAAMAAGDLVVLVQSSNFRLDAYRIRVELFKRALKVIEHPHLARMPGVQAQHYIASLAYDAAYYRDTGHALKTRIDQATTAMIDSGGAQLHFGPLESAKLNIGDYTGMANIGGQFPIGEVFTEARDLEGVNGEVRIFVFGDTEFSVNQPAQPITLVIRHGRVVDARNSTPAFDQVLANIRADEGEVWLRELGFGMNRAFGKDRTVDDIGSFERMCGIHLSLGAKHGVYNKPGFKRGTTRHHVDVFVDTHAVWLDGASVYRDGAWCVGDVATVLGERSPK